MSELTCPKCSGKMERVSYDAIEVDKCLVCRGLWFDAGELEKMSAAAQSESVDDGSPFIGELKDQRTDINCPRCQVAMGTFKPQAGDRSFNVERCPQCKGMFFDAGEFTDVKLDQSFWDALRARHGG